MSMTTKENVVQINAFSQTHNPTTGSCFNTSTRRHRTQSGYRSAQQLPRSKFQYPGTHGGHSTKIISSQFPAK